MSKQAGKKLTLRVTAKEFKMLKRLAAEANETVGDFCRRQVLRPCLEGDRPKGPKSGQDNDPDSPSSA